MATIKFRGDAPVVPQVSSITFSGSWASTETAYVEINAKRITVTATATMTAAQIASALAAAINGDAVTALAETRNVLGDTIPEFSDITATTSTATLILTADNERIFTATAGDTAASGSTGSVTAVQSATGPAHLIAANFEGGSLPTTGDTVVFAGAVPVLYRLDALSASGIVHVIFEAGFSDAGVCGLPNRGTATAGEFDEYLPQYLVLPADCDLTVGQGGGRGSSRIRVDLGGGDSTIRVFITSPSFDNDRYALELKNSGASSVLYLHGGEVDFCREIGSTGTLTTVYAAADSRLRCGSGATLGTINADGSPFIETASAITTVNMDGGKLETTGGNITTLNLNAGEFEPHAGGTIATTNLGAATVDLSQNVGSVTLTTINVKSAGFSILDPFGVATITNAIAFSGVGLADGTLVTGRGKSITVS